MFYFVRKETLTKLFGTPDSLKREYVATLLHNYNMEIWTSPLDLVKTRLQLLGDRYDPVTFIKHQKLNKDEWNKGFYATTRSVLKKEGTFALWKGLPPRLIFLALSTTHRLLTCSDKTEAVTFPSTFEAFRREMANAGVSCGIFTGTIASFLTTPLEMARIQLQMENKRLNLGLKPKTYNVVHGVYRAFQIGGIRALYKGCVPHTIKEFLLRFNEDSFQETVAFSIMQYMNLPWSFSNALAGTISLSVISTVCLPIDVVTTRLFNQGPHPPCEDLVYRNTIQCFKTILKDEGITGFYRGFVPFFLRSGFRTAFYEVTYKLFVLMLGYEF